jgi:TolB protein
MRKPGVHRILAISIVIAGVAIAAGAAPASAQQDTTRLPPGVELASRYTKLGRPLTAVRTFAGGAGDVAGVVRNDLLRSDRFEIAATPVSLDAGPVDYAVWNSLNIVYLVTGEMTPTGSGASRLALTVHDVVYGKVVQQRTFDLPPTTSRDYRLAIHVASDEVVRWLTQQPGMAATRIAFVRKNGKARYDLFVVDSDGENLQRLDGSPGILYSPSWSPDGRRLLYMVKADAETRLLERDMTSGRTRTVYSSGTLLYTPTYAPDGKGIAFALDMGAGGEIHTFDLARTCCLARLTQTQADNLSPTFSPDGRRIAFQSNRTGAPHIYVMDAGGGGPVVISPLGRDVQYASPDWSPVGDDVVFHGMSKGSYQLMLASGSQPAAQLQQLTSSGWNEDPSWAPDGRHIVFTGTTDYGSALYVIDTKTGQIRPLANGYDRLADWSPSLAGTIEH